ncbi:hypothetical protein ACFUC1_00355 [Pedococcus sp. NPDC057267]|uniref:hypothetical protein n=1 Tax=Pedococcus sp. NPDC057267 TaxID=3346077 RepID=UPI003631812B
MTEPVRRLRSGHRPAAAALAVVAVLGVAACGTDEMDVAMKEPAASGSTKAAPVCAKDAKGVDLPSSFPAEARVPDGYVVTGTEARSAGRTVVTAVSPKPFKQTLAEMQQAYSSRGWRPSEGEVEARDAESNFAGNGLRGRWAIREIPACPSNTAVSVLIGT